MMAPVWGVITFYTVKYFFMVLKTPHKDDDPA